MYTYIHMYIHTYVHTYRQTDIHTYTHIHTYKHTYICPYIHIYIKMSNSESRGQVACVHQQAYIRNQYSKLFMYINGNSKFLKCCSLATIIAIT